MGERKVDLYFTRHGKTQWNQEMRFQGREGDSPLLPSSYAEVKQLGHYLRDISFTRIYCSDSKRARETANVIAREQKQPPAVIYTEQLRELGLGSLEGKFIKEARQQYGSSLDALRYRIHQYDPLPFAGESYGEMLRRTKQVVVDAVEQETVGPLLFVGHGASLTGCIQSLAGKSLEQLRLMGGLDNNSLSILRVASNKKLPYQLIQWNNTDYLQ